MIPPDRGEPLTDQQRRVFQFVKRFLENQGYAPLFREIQEGTRLSNVGLVHKNLTALEKKGYINKEPNKKRGLSLTDVGREMPLDQVPGQLNLFDNQNRPPESDGED